MVKIIQNFIILFLFVAFTPGKTAIFCIEISNPLIQTQELPILTDEKLKIKESWSNDTLFLEPLLTIENYFRASHLQLDSTIIDGKYNLNMSCWNRV